MPQGYVRRETRRYSAPITISVGTHLGHHRSRHVFGHHVISQFLGDGDPRRRRVFQQEPAQPHRPRLVRGGSVGRFRPAAVGGRRQAFHAGLNSPYAGRQLLGGKPAQPGQPSHRARRGPPAPWPFRRPVSADFDDRRAKAVRERSYAATTHRAGLAASDSERPRRRWSDRRPARCRRGRESGPGMRGAPSLSRPAAGPRHGSRPLRSVPTELFDRTPAAMRSRIPLGRSAASAAGRPRWSGALRGIKLLPVEGHKQELPGAL